MRQRIESLRKDQFTQKVNELYKYLNYNNRHFQPMKKMSKALTINIIQDTNETPSPNQQYDSVIRHRDRIETIESDQDRYKHEERGPNRLNVVEFEQFTVQEDKPGGDQAVEKSTECKQGSKQFISKNLADKRMIHKNKKQFSIQIPEVKTYPQKPVASMSQSKTINHIMSDIYEKEDYKQPPAPSHKQSMKAKSFVFPTSQAKPPNKIVSQIKKSNSFGQEDYLSKIQQLGKNFQKERQQFYKEKSRYQKELMIKDGQIQMLQTIITSKFSSPNQPFLQKGHNTLFDRDSQFETIILQKDLEITQLLQKINQLNQTVEKKSDDLNQLKLQLAKSQSLGQSLKNQIYVYQKKEANDRMTRQFLNLKKIQKPITPTSKRWQDDGQSVKKQDLRYNGLQDLQKRLQSLKINRMQFQDRSKIKSEIAYSQTTKNKGKGAFDFKGVFYDYNRSKY